MATDSSYPTHGDRSRTAQAQRETHWRRILERCQQSGLSRTAFCQREGLKEGSLSWWARELREREQARRPVAASRKRIRRRRRPTFVPVRVKTASGSTAATLEVVTRGGHVVRLHPGFDPALLRGVLAALEHRPC